MEIRGEYWIQDGYVDFADGDIGDRNHEGIAIGAVVSQYADAVGNFAEQLGIEHECTRYGEPDTEAVSETLTQIYEKLTERKKRPMNGPQADAYIMRSVGCNEDAYAILCGHGDGREYAMEYFGWIAVRSHNVEFYGYSQEKRDIIANGIRDIIDQEDYSAAEELDPNDIDLWLEDHRTGQTWSVTLAELEEPTVIKSPQYPSNAKYNKSFTQFLKDPEENKYQNPAKSAESPWNTAAQKAGIGSELWRGTSESKWPGFNAWMEQRQNVRHS